MTSNQLQFQKNVISEAELAEQQRKNRENENIKYRELMQNLALKQRELAAKEKEVGIQEGKLLLSQAELDQKERENLAKYGYSAYMSENEERGGAREVFNLVPEVISTLLSPITGIASLFKGGRK